MAKWLLKAIAWIWNGRKERADTVFDGYDRLLSHWQKLLKPVEERLEACEQDREELHRRLDECDEDRQDLHRQIAGVKDQVETLEERTNGT